MPCQPNEPDFHAQPTSNTALVHTKGKVEPTLFGQYIGTESVFSKPHMNGWLYLLRSERIQTYEQLEVGLKTLEKNLHRESSNSTQLFHSIGSAGEIVVLGAHSSLLNEIIDTDGELCDGVDVWRMNETRKHEKRPEKQMLIPGFKRLSRQLQVDFATNVHGGEGKRRRDPVRSIYEEAAQERANKKKRTRRQYNRKPIIAPSTDNESEDVSDIEDDELLRHAEMLASLSNASGQVTPEVNTTRMERKPTRPEAAIIDSLARAMDIVTQAHVHALQAKDDTIRAMETASKALTETVNTQSALIAELLSRV